MKNIFKKNQIIITALAIMIVIAGYLTFSGKNEEQQKGNIQNTAETELETYDLTEALENDMLEATTENAETELATTENESSLVAEDGSLLDLSEEDIENGEIAAVDVADNGELVVETASEIETPGEAVLASSVISSGFFSTAKLSREQTRAKNKDTLNEIINNTNVADSVKEDAVARLIEITKIAETENATELMLNGRGFDDAVVSVLDGKVDVVVNASALSDQQLAQIEDIVTKKTGITLENIAIYPVVAQE